MQLPKLFIDFEASGIAPDSYPIEVAVVFDEGDSYQTLISRAPHWEHWSYDAEDMHGISQEDLEREGKSPRDVAIQLNYIFRGLTLCSDSPMDTFWLDVLYEAAGLEPTFTVQPLEALIGADAATEVMTLLPSNKKHRALPDAKRLHTAFLTYGATLGA